MVKNRYKHKIFRSLLVIILSIPVLSFSQEESSDDIAKKMQNPLSSLIAVPVHHSFSFGASQIEKTAYGVSFQPIFPFKFEKFNIVNRVIFGYGYVPGIVAGTQLIPQGAPQNGEVDGTWGLSDINYSFFLSPKTTHKIAWGVGPSINLPSARDNRLGTGKWSVGPSIVAVYQAGRWTMDVVLRQTWSVGGDHLRRDVNQFVATPLVAYSLGNGYMLSTFPSISANWDFEEGQRWTIPVGGGLSKVLFLGKLPVAVAAQYYQNVVRPDFAANSEFRISTTFILAK